MKFTAILKSFDEAYGLIPLPVTITENRRFVYVNDACCQVYRRKREFFIGKTADCLVEDKAALEGQQDQIRAFNERLSTEGASLRYFRNTIEGKLTTFYVVAFSRRVKGREFRVGIALAESHFGLDRMSCVLANQLVGGTIDLQGFSDKLAKNPRYRELIRDLGQGISLKQSGAYSTAKNNHKAFDRIKDLAEQFINGGMGPSPSADTIKGLAILIGNRFGGQ